LPHPQAFNAEGNGRGEVVGELAKVTLSLLKFEMRENERYGETTKS